MKKISKFALTFFTELVPWVGSIVPAWTIYVFSELKRDGQLTAPEGLIMFPVGILLDIIALVVVFFALDDWGTVEILGTLVIGGWSLIRSQVTNLISAA